LLEPTLLTAPEVAWLNAYHARVRSSLLPLLDPATAAWLEHTTEVISCMNG
jgi:Xaa-Pro aminopeptidase